MKYGIILLIFLLSFRPIIPLVNYGINYDYISKFLCINKDKPNLNCNGKCYLVKELAKKAAEDPKENTQNVNIILDAFVLNEKFTFSFNNFRVIPTNNNYYHINLYSFLSYEAILKPPVV